MYKVDVEKGYLSRFGADSGVMNRVQLCRKSGCGCGETAGDCTADKSACNVSEAYLRRLCYIAFCELRVGVLSRVLLPG